MPDPGTPRKIDVSDKALDFALVDAWGQLRSLRPGRETTPAVLAFFKATCPTCQLAMPFLDRLFRAVEGKPIRFWGIAQEEKVEAHRFSVDFGVTFPLALDLKPYRVSRSYGLTHVPVVYVVEPNGDVSRRVEGFVKREYAALAFDLSRRLGVPPFELFQPGERVPELQPG
ncbi:MAG: TlpA family protein disulfide reductase [Planctomycetes bacterium]|nr:TlpA family protein disulfide reductase [Planctomycetota bacterium]MBI3844760.1 TlpA family protein disulfide reductase [Planctomycetota bacterium]